MIALSRRVWLWSVLVFLIAALLGALIWLVGEYERSKFEDELDFSVSELAGDIRNKLGRNAQRLQTLAVANESEWLFTSKQMLEQGLEIVRIEKRSQNLQIQTTANSLFLNPHDGQGVFTSFGRENFSSEVSIACALAARSLEAAYSPSYFVPTGSGTGIEVMDMCLPQFKNNHLTGYVVVTYSLERILREWGAINLKRKEELSFRAADGSRLAALAHTVRPGTRFAAQTVVNLQGITLILHIENWRSAPYWVANTPTALVLLLAIALTAVLWLLYRDTRRRLRAEQVSRQSLERLQKSARLATLGEMASMLSHELNQPLAAITSYASGSLNLLEQEALAYPAAQDLADIKTALERISAQSERAGLVIKSVHDFVRRSETERTPTQAQAIVDEVLPLLGLLAKQMNIQLKLQIEKNLPYILCNKTLIEQVIINLARNGIQAMGMQTMGTQHHGGSKNEFTSIAPRVLTITAQKNADSVEFLIQDFGPGLPAEILEKLFTPFFTTKTEGMGLGLSLCRTVIEQHGSSLAYTTNTAPPHTGTTFSFKLTTHHASAS